jgi:dTDP-4-dehydrorhamnose reductase
LRYAVLGAAGQLGRDLCPRLKGDVTPLTREQADLTRADELRRTLSELKPDAVVNCAAYNFVDRAETEPEAAFAVNAWAVGQLAKICRDLDSTLVTFSTDYVFGLDESRRAPYRTDDAPGPVSVYGLNKLAGEYLARAGCPKHFVIRTCGLYGVWGSGGKGGNFVEIMRRLGAQGKPIRVVDDQTCTPSYTADIATATADLIETGRYGLYQLTNAGSCTWCEFARGIFEAAGIKREVIPITSQEYGAAARRPGYSVLASDAYEALQLPRVRHWKEAIAAYMSERDKTRGSDRAPVV